MKKTNNIIKQDAIICLAAGKSQMSLLAKAKSLGYFVVAIDKNPTALGLKYVDVAICKSTYDAKEIIKELDLLKNKYRWIGVLNRSSGPPVSVAAELSEYFNIPGVPVESANTLVNKDQFRKACTKYDLPTPKYQIFSITDTKSITEVNYPVVIKPALSLIGKSGISVVSSKNQLESAIVYAIENTINDKIIIEEYLPGPDLSLVGFIRDKKLCPICLLDELNVELDDGKVASRGYKIHSPSNNIELELMAHTISQRIADVFEISRSAFLASFRMASDGELRLIEIHLDLGGDLLMEEVFPKALSYDFEELAVKMCVGDAPCPENGPITPTAIFYERGDALLNERGFQVITADSHEMLNKKIMDAGI